MARHPCDPRFGLVAANGCAVFMLESMGFETGIDLTKLIDARRLLHERLPAEPMHGQVPRAGIPRTFRAAA